MANPWMTSSDLISSVKRRISVPISQVTFSEDDILAFANEEVFISQVPSVLEYHEEYFVDTILVPLQPNISTYEIPDRAIGMKLRGLYWADVSNNLFEMTRIGSDDRAFFQRNIGANQAIHKFFLQGNSVVLTPTVTDNPTGHLVFVYYLRPNQLVQNTRASFIQSFQQTITVNNSSIVAGDKVTIFNVVFTAVSGSPGTNEFQIGVSDAATATNLVNVINTNGTVGTASITTNIVKVIFSELPPLSQVLNSLAYNPIVNPFSTSNTSGFVIPSTLSINCDQVPANITTGSLVDFLQTAVGHKIRSYDVEVANISSNTITFNITDVPPDLIVGDNICSANECIIPGIPTDLHNALAERTAGRILASLGDMQGLQVSQQKLAEIERSQGELLDQRVEGNPKKINARHTLLRYGKMGIIRRF